MEMIDVLTKLREIAESKPELVKDAVDNVERTNPKAVTEGGMKDYLHDEAEKLSREEFIKKHGESLAGFWDSINGTEESAVQEDTSDDRIEKAMKNMQPSNVTGYYDITDFWKEHTQMWGKTDDEVMHMIYEWTWDEIGYSGSQERDELAKRTSAIVVDALKNNKDDMTFDDMIEQLKGKKEDQVNELEPDAEPIDAPVQAPVDHGAVVQSFLTDPENKLVLRKDASADKMLSATQFKDKNTMLGSILSDIASRLLTKSGEEDRVANFASRVADGIEQEGSNSFKPGPDYNSNKKIAVQLAKRYIDDYKKMQQDPAYADEVRMDPADFNPKKDIKGKAIGKETEAFESWVDETVNEYATPKDAEDRKAKMKAIQDLQMDPNTSKDPELQAEIQKRKKELGMQKEAESDYLYHNGKEIDQSSIMYDMQDYSDGIFELQSAKYADGTELDEKELEELESTDELIEWVRIDFVSEGNQLEGLTFEDIKPYVSMYTDKETGKKVNAVLDKDGAEVFKTHDAKAAMAYLSQNYDKLKREDAEDEADDKEQEIAKDQADAEKINTELDRIKQLANIQ